MCVCVCVYVSFDTAAQDMLHTAIAEELKQLEREVMVYHADLKQDNAHHKLRLSKLAAM